MSIKLKLYSYESVPHYYGVLNMIYSILLYKRKWFQYEMNRVMRKPTFYICENKDADQLRGDREADQRLCFRNIDLYYNPSTF